MNVHKLLKKERETSRVSRDGISNWLTGASATASRTWQTHLASHANTSAVNFGNPNGNTQQRTKAVAMFR